MESMAAAGAARAGGDPHAMTDAGVVSQPSGTHAATGAGRGYARREARKHVAAVPTATP
eukprot:gene13165-18424_t